MDPSSSSSEWPYWWELVRAVVAAVLGWLAGWKFPPTRKE